MELGIFSLGDPVLTYADDSSARGKATADSDIVEARFVDVVPGVRVVQSASVGRVVGNEVDFAAGRGQGRSSSPLRGCGGSIWTPPARHRGWPL
jgi:hypothetical protein